VDPTGLLDAVLAVAVYPGAAFLALATLLHVRVAGRPAGHGTPGGVPAARLLPVIAATVAVTMLPLAGSPALRLPPLTGVGSNVVAVAVLLAVAVDRAGGSRRASLLAIAAACPVFGLAAAGSTVSAVAISTAAGVAGIAARFLAAAILVLAASATAAGRTASVAAAALALTAAALTVPAALPDAPPIASVPACVTVVAFSGLLARLRRGAEWSPLTAVAGAAAVAGTALALLSSRT
jgi:hypothetical protein